MSRALFIVALVTAACGPAAQGGLANAPALSRPASPEDREDAISNGPRSCPPSGRPGDDPLRNRSPHCAEAGPPPASSARRP